MKKILLLDNYDSFTYNLLHLIEKVSDQHVEVIKNDQVDTDSLEQYSRIVLSPGPGLPSRAGRMPELIKKAAGSLPVLGICLGMQAIAEHFGCRLRNLETVFHGRAWPVKIIEPGTLFRNCPGEFLVARYHSWVVDENHLGPDIVITAKDPEGRIMGLRHISLNVCGLQFHPESILSEYGETMMRNWMNS